MSAPVTTKSDWQWPPDVMEFATQHQVQACLEPMLEATRRLFPTARWIKVYLQDDPEIKDDRYMVFDVRVAGLSPREALDIQRQWNEALFSCYPRPRLCVFGLLLDLVSS